MTLSCCCLRSPTLSSPSNCLHENSCWRHCRVTLYPLLAQFQRKRIPVRGFCLRSTNHLGMFIFSARFLSHCFFFLCWRSVIRLINLVRAIWYIRTWSFPFSCLARFRAPSSELQLFAAAFRIAGNDANFFLGCICSWHSPVGTLSPSAGLEDGAMVIQESYRF